MFISQRNLLIAGAVVLLHAVALWALQAGLLRRTIVVFVPVESVSQVLMTSERAVPPPPSPIAPPPTPVPPPPLARAPAPQTQTQTPASPAVPSPNAPAAQFAPPASVAPPTGLTAMAVTPVPAPAPAPPRIDMPSSDADYLQNPKPAYPPTSKRLGEQGNVVVRVLIGADGMAQRAEVRQSSGFDRLDQAALLTVLKWRYVPGKREGAPEAMWFNVPINFVLE